MILFALFAYISQFFIIIVSANDLLERLFLLRGPCFEVVDSPTCNSSLADGFEFQVPTDELIGPTTQAFLFTARNPNVAEELHLCGGELPPNSTYDREAETEIFIHGWLDGVCRSAWMREMKEQLFVRGNYNVILIDWTWGNTPEFVLAGLNSKVVGEQVGFLINNIMKQTGVGPEKFHLIGHNVGTIATGFVGRNVEGLRRVTALDPSFLPYGVPPPVQRVTYRDAQIVDVIHTSAVEAGCVDASIDDVGQTGHADFYPNGGRVQPSCYPNILIGFLKGDIFPALFSLIDRSRRYCFHLQSIQYYKASINPGNCQLIGVSGDFYTNPNNTELIPARICEDWAVMGMDYELYQSENSTERKKYFLYTRALCPYCDPYFCQLK